MGVGPDQNERDFAALAEAARSGRISTAGQRAGPGTRRHRPSPAPAARVKAGRPRMPSAVGPRGGAGALSGTTEGGHRNRAADP
ncbi:hypothetical protein FRAHR75_430038 [Frankia sp. Hr75.2]|nr:hypothetical protein FRAHR75_430038 [Frankia sp. Hr75.2]